MSAPAYYETFLQSLRKATSKLDLDMLIVDFAKSPVLGEIVADTSELKQQIAIELREKLYTLVLADGDVFEQDYIAIYAFFANIELPLDSRFEPFVALAQNQIGEAQTYHDSAELVVLIELAVVSLILQGKAFEALKFYIFKLSTVHLADALILQRSGFALLLFALFNLNFEQVYPIFEELFALEHILSLSPIARRSVFVWTLHQWWNVPSFFNHLAWAKLYPLWRKIFYHVLESDFEFAVYLQFFVYHFMGNSYHTQEQWKGLNADFSKKAEPYYIEFGKTQPPCKKEMSKGKKLVGFLRDRIVQNSPGKVEYSLLKALQQSPEITERYTFKLYIMGFVEKSDDEQKFIKDYENLGIEVVDVVSAINQNKDIKMPFYASHLQRALAIRNRIIADGVDILISPNNGYGISDLIIATRSAPLQIFWSHGNGVYDIAGIDKRMSHFQPESSIFSFEQIVIPMDIDTFYNPPISKEAIATEISRYPKDKIVLGVIGRLVKVDCEEYLATIAEVMQQNPDTIFIAAGGGNLNSVRAKVRKLGIPDERFFLPGHIDPHLYGHLIDIFCNTFPLQQGESLSEFMHKGKAWIGLDPNHCYEKYQAANFSEELQALKLSSKVLLFIRNAKDCNPNLKNWNEILDNPEVVLLCTPAQQATLAPIVPKQCRLVCVEKDPKDLEILADIVLAAFDKSLHMTDSATIIRLGLKSINPFLRYYKGMEIYNRCYTEFIPKHSELFAGEQNEGIFFYSLAYTIEDYKRYLNKIIQNPLLRLQMGKAIQMELEFLHKERQELCVKEFLRVCQ